MDSSQEPHRVLRRHPLTPYIAGAVLGLLLVSRDWLEPIVWSGLSLIPLMAAGLSLFNRNAPTVVSLFLLGLGLPASIYLANKVHDQQLRQSLRNRDVHVEGEVTVDGRLRVRWLDGEPSSHELYLPRNQHDELADSGEPVEVTVTGSVSWPHHSPGFSQYLKNQGFHGTFKVGYWHGIEEIERPARPLRVGLRGWVADQFNRWEDNWPRTVELLRALVLGEKQALPQRVRDLLHGLGLSHLFVISGLHVGYILYGLRFVFGTPDNPLSALGYCSVIVAYLAFLGFPVPAVRAGLMAFFWVGAVWFQRRSAVMVSFLSTVAVLLSVNPAWLFDVGFQLSASAMVGIFAVMPLARQAENWPGVPFLTINVGAYLGVVPVLLYQLGTIPRWGHIAGFVGGLVFQVLIVLLIVQVILMSSGAEVWPYLPERLIEWGMDGLSTLFHWLEPGTYQVDEFPLVVAVVLGLGLWGMLDRNLGGFGQVLCLLMVVILLLPVVSFTPPKSLGLRQADSTAYWIARTTEPPKTALLVRPYDQPSSYELYLIERYLRGQGLSSLDLVVSDFPERFWRVRGWSLPVGNFRQNWQEGGRINLGSLRWLPERHRVKFQDWSLSWRAQPPVGPTDPPGLYGKTSRGTWVITNPGRVDESLYSWFLEQPSRHLLTEGPLWVHRGGVELKQPPEQGYRQRWRRLLNSLL